MLFDNIMVQKQPTEMTNWCWAAASANVVSYYQRQNVPACTIVQEVIGNGEGLNCCSGPNQACNRKLALEDALGRYGRQGKIFGTRGFRHVADEITAGRPVAFRIVWNNSGDIGHFVIADGVNDVAQELFIRDPDPNREDNWFNYDEFLANYLGAGIASNTYFTV